MSNIIEVVFFRTPEILTEEQKVIDLNQFLHTIQLEQFNVLKITPYGDSGFLIEYRKSYNE